MEDLVKVRNRSNGMAGYTLKDQNLSREFAAGEVKKIPKDELISVSYTRGGRTILKHYLQILTDDEEFLRDLLGESPEPEYKYTREEVIDLMVKGTLDQFLDLLDFAPKAILEIIKTEAVNLKINDVSKRQAIKKKTGFDVDAAIKNTEVDSKEEATKPQEEVKSNRRVPIKEEEKPASKYKVVNKEEN